MRAEVEIITPAYAKQLLAQNCPNRPLSKSTVNRYANDMTNDRWNNNGQGIVLTAEGKLLDGQHRMAAVLKAGIPVGMLVVRGVPEETFKTMDSGKARSLSDVLAIEGYVNTPLLAAVAVNSYRYACGAANYHASKAALEVFVRAHPYLVDASGLLRGKSSKLPKTPIAAVVFLANEKRAYDAETVSFVEALLSGEGLFKGDPRLTLREWMINHKGLAGVFQQQTFAATARAWNAHVSGRELVQLRGLVSATFKSVPITGFDRTLYPDVPDVSAQVEEKNRQNLAKARSNLPSSQVTFGVEREIRDVSAMRRLGAAS